MAQTIIIGGGIIGLCSAYYLQKAGHSVSVIDKDDISKGASFVNMGYMSPSHFVPLASPGIISEGLKYMLSSSSPFYIKPRLDWNLAKWAWHFYKSSNASLAKKHAPHLNNILQLSRQLINDIKDDLGNRFDMQEIGCLMMCKQHATLEHEFELADEAEKLGLQVERLHAPEVQALETNVELDVAGAVLFKDDCHFDPGKLMLLLKDHLVKNGVQFYLNENVISIETSGDRATAVITGKQKHPAENVVLASGSWLPQLSGMLKQSLLLQPGKGYSYTYDDVEKNIKYPAILVDGRCAITPWNQRLRIGGTMELSGINHNIMLKRMQGIYDSAKSFYPGLQIAQPVESKIVCGLRPVSPDGLPFIGKTTHFKNAVIAGGHAMLGISQGPGTGLIVSQLLDNKKTEIDISAFDISRFD